jgi:hypothetical protein
MFQPTELEFDHLKSHFVTSSAGWGGPLLFPAGGNIHYLGSFFQQIRWDNQSIFRTY